MLALREDRPCAVQLAGGFFLSPITAWCGQGLSFADAYQAHGWILSHRPHSWEWLTERTDEELEAIAQSVSKALAAHWEGVYEVTSAAIARGVNRAFGGKD